MKYPPDCRCCRHVQTSPVSAHRDDRKHMCVRNLTFAQFVDFQIHFIDIAPEDQILILTTARKAILGMNPLACVQYVLDTTHMSRQEDE